MILRIKWWGIVALYSAVIFLTLPYGPKIVETIRKGIGERGLSYSLNISMAVVVVSLLFYLIFYLKERRIFSYLLFAIIGLIYGYFFRSLHVPAERFHFLEYGLLSWLVYYALRLDIRSKLIYLWTVIVISLIGALDEGVQWILPNRFFCWRDVGLNSLAGILGQGMIWILRRHPVGRSLMPQSLRGVEGGRPVGRINPEDQPHQGGEG